MKSNAAFKKAEKFFKNNPSCIDALKQIKPGVAILISLEGQHKCTLSVENDKIAFLDQEPENFDIEFELKNEALRRLSALSKLSVSQVGIEVVKEALLGHIEITNHSGIFNFMKNGYVKIIRLAGPEFLSFLAAHGLGSLQKIIVFIRKM